MKKRNKLIAALSTAVLLTLGMSVSSFAASGWQEENGTWTYLDSNGGYVTSTWKKSGSQYFYLNETGEMAANALIESDGNKYYVDANGARVTSQWVSLRNDDGQWDADISTVYYYFGSTGKAYAGAKKIIEGKTYIFDEEGHMLSGWQTYGDNNDLYYMGNEDEGWAYTGWHYLEPDGNISEEDSGWFYFDLNKGKAFMNSRKYINGSYYTFDENGIMNDRWVIGTPGAPDYTAIYDIGSDSSARYKEDTGNLQTGWIYAYAPDDPDETGDKEWYYLDSKGVPFNEHAKDTRICEGVGSAVKYTGDRWLYDEDDRENDLAARVIKNKTYLFDKDGKMLTGVYLVNNVCRMGSSSPLGHTEVTRADGTKEYIGETYYFNHGDGSTRGQMMTGRQTITYEGDSRYFYFRKDGRAYTNTIADGALYGADGIRVNADDGNAYELVSIGDYMSIREKGNNNKHSDCTMIVSSSGKVKKSGTVKIDGYRYTVENYEVIKTEAVD